MRSRPHVHGLLERNPLQSEFEDLSDIFRVEDSRELVDRHDLACRRDEGENQNHYGKLYKRMSLAHASR
jgi:hypothetical protein